MFWYIVGYIVLTSIAIWYGKDEDIFESDGVEFFIRVFFLLTIGWLVALLSGIGALLLGAGMCLGDQTMGVQLEQDENLYVMPWTAKWIGRQLKKLIPKRKKKEEVEVCLNDSLNEQEG